MNQQQNPYRAQLSEARKPARARWPNLFTLWFLVALPLWFLLSMMPTDYDSRDPAAYLVLSSAVWACPIWFCLEIGLPPIVAIPLGIIVWLAAVRFLDRRLAFIFSASDDTDS